MAGKLSGHFDGSIGFGLEYARHEILWHCASSRRKHAIQSDAIVIVRPSGTGETCRKKQSADLLCVYVVCAALVCSVTRYSVLLWYVVAVVVPRGKEGGGMVLSRSFVVILWEPVIPSKVLKS